MPNPSLITTQLTVDLPLVQNAQFSFSANDRQYIDNQIRGTQQHVVDLVLSGVVGTWMVLDAGSVAVSVGDCVCLAGSLTSARTVTKATATPLAAAGALFGVVLAAAAPGGAVKVATTGALAPTITGLAAGANVLVKINTATARLQTVAVYAAGEYQVGIIDAAGNLSLRPMGAANGSTVGAAGGDLIGSYPNPTVAQISGSGGNVVLICYPTFRLDVSNPVIKQADQTTNGINGQPFKTQAQNATGTAATGGSNTMQSGTGTSGTGDLLFNLGNTQVLGFLSASLSLEFAETITTGIKQTARTSNAVCHDFTLTSQAPFAGSTGANRNPGNFVYAVPAPDGAGTAGKHSFKVSGTEVVSFGAAIAATLTSTNSTASISTATPHLDLINSGSQTVIRFSAGGAVAAGIRVDNSGFIVLQGSGISFNDLGNTANYVNLSTTGIAFASTITPVINAPGNSLSLQFNGTTRFQINTTGIGFFNVSPVARTAGYTVTNPTTDRALNVTADTLAQGLQVLGTLIADLQLYGLLG